MAKNATFQCQRPEDNTSAVLVNNLNSILSADLYLRCQGVLEAILYAILFS